MLEPYGDFVVNESESVPPSDWLPEPPPASPRESEPPGTPYVKILVAYTCVIAVGMGLAWSFLAMRDEDGSWLMAIGIPMMLIAMFVGSGVGMAIGAPATLLPMWALLFTLLGWNFLEFGFTDGTDVGLIVSGVVFWVMALPAWLAMFAALRKSVRSALSLDPEKKEKVDKKVAKARASMWASGSLDGSLWWWLIYAVLGAGGAFFGVAVYAAAA